MAAALPSPPVMEGQVREASDSNRNKDKIEHQTILPSFFCAPLAAQHPHSAPLACELGLR
jgi:hypothetical protein